MLLRYKGSSAKERGRIGNTVALPHNNSTSGLRHLTFPITYIDYYTNLSDFLASIR